MDSEDTKQCFIISGAIATTLITLILCITVCTVIDSNNKHERAIAELASPYDLTWDANSQTWHKSPKEDQSEPAE